MLRSQCFDQSGDAKKHTHNLFKSTLDGLLIKHVMDANPDEVKKMLASQRPDDCLVLKKTNAVERCGRKWTNISPLEAAALSGDTDMIKHLLVYVPDHFKNQAAEQLQNLLKRDRSAENGVYLSAYHSLIAAYEKFNQCYDELSAKDDWKMLEKIWIREVGLAQRMLPSAGLQEFFSDKRFDDELLVFDKPPARSCQFYAGCPLDLSSLGVSFALYHGQLSFAIKLSQLEIPESYSFLKTIDLDAMKQFCKIRAYELNSIIERLLTPAEKSQHTLVS